MLSASPRGARGESEAVFKREELRFARDRVANLCRESLAVGEAYRKIDILYRLVDVRHMQLVIEPPLLFVRNDSTFPVMVYVPPS